MNNSEFVAIIVLLCKFVTFKCESDEKPLILTPLLESNKTDVAKQSSEVIIPGFEDVKSHSGFITVDESCKSNLFFWFFKSEEGNAPVSVWLQGGPGGSSLIGSFYENGPFSATNDSKLERRQFSWTKAMHMLYIDSPVGTGFSFTDNENCYTKNRTQYTEHLFIFMKQFYKLFPELQNNGLYLMGESYGCKPVVSLAYKLFNEKDENIKLKGVAIGGGFCDPLIQSKYSKLLHEVPQMNAIQAKKLKVKEAEMEYLVKTREYRIATLVWMSLWGILSNINPYNYEQQLNDGFTDDYIKVINETNFRRLIHVGNAEYNDIDSVFDNLSWDFMQSMKHLFPVLIENFDVLVFNGNLDVITAASLTDDFIEKIEWNDIDGYRNATQESIKIDNKIVGYVKQFKKLTRATILNAGHLTPHDSPNANYNLIVKFISDAN